MAVVSDWSGVCLAFAGVLIQGTMNLVCAKNERAVSSFCCDCGG
jgi:hypothetical protein